MFRSFKRSKEGTIRSDSARFAELTEGKAEILADRVGTVNEKCRDVLGLSREDFFPHRSSSPGKVFRISKAGRYGAQ